MSQRVSHFYSSRFSYYRTKGLWWFRIYGKGIHWKDSRLFRPLFSERNGYGPRLLKLGHWCFKVLR